MNVGRGCWVMSSCRCLMVLPCVHLTMYVYGFVSAQDVLSPWGPRPSSDVSMGCHVTSFDHSDGFCTVVGLFLGTVFSCSLCCHLGSTAWDGQLCVLYEEICRLLYGWESLIVN